MPYYLDNAEMGMSLFGVPPWTIQPDWFKVVCLAEPSLCVCVCVCLCGGILGAEKKDIWSGLVQSRPMWCAELSQTIWTYSFCSSEK